MLQAFRAAYKQTTATNEQILKKKHTHTSHTQNSYNNNPNKNTLTKPTKHNTFNLPPPLPSTAFATFAAALTIKNCFIEMGLRFLQQHQQHHQQKKKTIFLSILWFP